MNEKFKEEEVVKVLVVLFLISLSIFLISMYRIELSGYSFYTHFFYLPAVLSSFWWGRKGVITSIFLIFFTILINAIAPYSPEEIFSSFIESTILLSVALLVAILAEEKNRALEKERQFKLMTAHYFFNPICIAEGFLDLAMKIASPEVNEKLEFVRVAIHRIKKVVKNVVEKGEIRE